MIRRRLAEEHPEAFLSDLAQSLNNLGIRLSAVGVGRPEEALEASREAVSYYRQLARSQPEQYLSELAMGLNNLGLDLRGQNLLEDALEVSQEALRIYRDLYNERSDAFLLDVAMSLDNLGEISHDRGQLEEALAYGEEALRSLVEFIQSHHDLWKPWMTTLVENYRRYLAELEREGDRELLAGAERRVIGAGQVAS